MAKNQYYLHIQYTNHNYKTIVSAIYVLYLCCTQEINKYRVDDQIESGKYNKIVIKVHSCEWIKCIIMCIWFHTSFTIKIHFHFNWISNFTVKWYWIFECITFFPFQNVTITVSCDCNSNERTNDEHNFRLA